MGSGAVDGKATFYPEGKQANFEMKLAVKRSARARTEPRVSQFPAALR